MTSLQIELPTEVYAQLQYEARRQGKAAKQLAQELLTGQLLATTSFETPLYIRIMPHIRVLVARMPVDDFTVPGDGSLEEAMALLRSWSKAAPDDDDADTESWEDVLHAIDANRSSERKLFPHLEQPE